jgi:NADH:ubiquinone oxidoreductase subunit 4 (subunit M)
VPASVTQILVIVVCLVVIAAAVYFRSTFRRTVYNQMQQSSKPKSKIQKFLGW